MHLAHMQNQSLNQNTFI